MTPKLLEQQRQLAERVVGPKLLVRRRLPVVRRLQVQQRLQVLQELGRQKLQVLVVPAMERGMVRRKERVRVLLKEQALREKVLRRLLGLRRQRGRQVRLIVSPVPKLAVQERQIQVCCPFLYFMVSPHANLYVALSTGGASPLMSMNGGMVTVAGLGVVFAVFM
jgi:hypothetical protein